MPEQKLNLLQLAALRAHSFAAARRRSCDASSPIPICAAYSRTSCHTARSVNASLPTRPFASTRRKIGPFSIPCHIQPPINLLLHPQRHRPAPKAQPQQSTKLQALQQSRVERRAHRLSLHSCLPGSLLYCLLERAWVRFRSFHRIAQLRAVWLKTILRRHSS